MCGTVGAVDKEKTSFHVLLNVPLSVFPICMTRTKFPGTDHFYRKKWVLGDLKISVQGTEIFRTKIPVTDLSLCTTLYILAFERSDVNCRVY